MQFKGWKFVGAALLAGSAATSFAAPLVLKDSLSLTSNGWYSVVSTSQHLAYRISNAAGDVAVNQVTLAVRLAVGGSGWPSVEVCSDGAGGTSPNLSDCTTFTPLDPVTNAFGPVRFQGSKTFSAGQAVWVVSKSMVPANDFYWATGPGPVGRYSPDSGATWIASTEDFALRVDAEPVVATPPTAVPTLSELGLLIMTLLVAASARVFLSRRQA